MRELLGRAHSVAHILMRLTRNYQRWLPRYTPHIIYGYIVVYSIDTFSSSQNTG